MEGIKDLNKLLKKMRPELVNGEYVFCTLPEAQYNKLQLDSLLVYNEKEGITVIIERKTADINSLSYSNVWALITLTVHSDLSAIGFLAKITNKLAESGISVNVISAYYHDHLFVPIDLAEKTIEILTKM